MQIITNTSSPQTTGHFGQLSKLFEQATSITLMSPFLTRDFSSLMGSFDLSNLEHLHLITTLQPRTLDQFGKLDSIVSLIDLTQVLSKKKSVDLRISIDNSLHGKVYLFRKNSIPFSAIITSANFTDSGLRRNHEWGVLIEDELSLDILERSISEATNYTDLTVEDAIEMLDIVDQYRGEHGDLDKQEAIDLDLNNILGRRGKSLDFEIEGRIWLKPIGVSDDPVLEGTVFSEEVENLHFSKRRPSGVSIGDTIIAYGVGTGYILSYYTVVSSPQRIPDNEMVEEWHHRWPWYVEANNQSLSFGSQWWKFHLHINTLTSNFLSENGDEAVITAAGGRTLGALNYGADKVGLSSDFGQYMLSHIRGSIT